MNTDHDVQEGLLEWCDTCPEYQTTCQGTNHPVFCPRVEKDDPEWLHD